MFKQLKKFAEEKKYLHKKQLYLCQFMPIPVFI